MAKRPRREPPAVREQGPVRWVALLIFASAFVVRLLFWTATPDRAWAWTAYMKGDAALWLDWARAIELGSLFELGLPIHPPGAAYLVSLLWDGQAASIGFLRFAWIAVGALVPLFVFLAAVRSFGSRVAVVAGCWTVLATGLLVLSTSLDSETPYLALVLGSFVLADGLRERPRAGRLAAWSALNGAACLFRVEHALFVALALAFLASGWLRRGAPWALRRTAASLVCFVLPLVPWHLSAWSAVRRFNEEPRRLTPTEEAALSAVEERLAGVTWTAGALRERDRLPAFLRRTASAFVLATVAHRGGREVREGDFAILDQAFGYRPRPLRAHPFVSSYGPLNFALANHAGSSGAFDRSLLEKPPPLVGGAAAYPAYLVRGLPPADLTFIYPPHLELFNEGYSIGGRWIANHPGDFALLAVRKVGIFWSGAASGLSGWNLPLGPSGIRRPVDMITAGTGLPAVVWRLAILIGCTAGSVAARRNPAIVPWLFLAATRLAATILFFGYARQGATAIPVVAVLLGLALQKRLTAKPLHLALLILLSGVAVEGGRFLAKPEMRLDGTVIGSTDPFPTDDHGEHRVDVRFSSRARSEN